MEIELSMSHAAGIGMAHVLVVIKSLSPQLDGTA